MTKRNAKGRTKKKAAKSRTTRKQIRMEMRRIGANPELIEEPPKGMETVELPPDEAERMLDDVEMFLDPKDSRLKAWD